MIIDITKFLTLNIQGKANFFYAFMLLTTMYPVIHACQDDKKKQQDQKQSNIEFTNEAKKSFNIKAPSNETLTKLGFKSTVGFDLVVIGQRNRANCSFDTFEKRYPFNPEEEITVELDGSCDLSIYLAIVEKDQAPRFERAELDFENDIQPILQKECLHCHNSGSGRTTDNLETYSDIFLRRQSIKNHIIRGTMPPPPVTMHPEDIALITQWVDGGGSSPAKAKAKAKPFVASKRAFISKEDFKNPKLMVEPLEYRLVN